MRADACQVRCFRQMTEVHVLGPATDIKSYAWFTEYVSGFGLAVGNHEQALIWW